MSVKKKTLVVAEKPSVAADFVKVLPGKFKKENKFWESDEYVVSYAVGHLVTISDPGEIDERFKSWKMDTLPILPDSFQLKPITSSRAQLTALGKLMRRRDVGEIINACDAGREGELIFAYILEYVTRSRKLTKNIFRLWLQSMTPAAIKEGFASLREHEEMSDLSSAAMCRSEADWLIGINGSRGLTAYNSRGGGFFLTPCGRVQTPTLSMIVKREEARLSFNPVDYWTIQAEFKDDQGSTYLGKWFNSEFKADKCKPDLKANRIWEKSQAEDIVTRVAGQIGLVEETSKPSTQSCGPLYDLTTLQREANSRFGFSAKMTLNLAQALYEKFKVLTYPRTDSKCLPEDYIKDTYRVMGNLKALPGLGVHAAKVLNDKYIRPNKRIFNNKKISDHHAIVPTGEIAKGLPEAEAKLYQMVVQRYIAVFFPPAEYLNTVRITEVADEKFRTEGKVLKVPGWKVVYGKSNEGEKLLEALSSSEVAHLHSEIEADETRPPARFTESTLLSAMEHAGKMVDDEELAEALKERGLGTPATRAAVIEKLLSDKYLLREGRDLVPTRKAFDLLKIIDAMEIEDLRSPELTGDWEQALKEIERGQKTRQEFMDEVRKMTVRIVDQIRGFDEESTKKEASFSPINEQKIFEYLTHYEMEDGTGRIRKILGGRHMSEEEIATLYKERRIGPYHDFVSRRGAQFTAFVNLTDENKVEFLFDDPEEESLDLSQMEPIGNSPIDDSPVYETLTAYVSKSNLDGDEKNGLKISKSILGKDIGLENMKLLLNGEKSKLIEGFRSSRTRRFFDAFLELDKKGKISFSFPPRAPRKGRRPAKKKEE